MASFSFKGNPILTDAEFNEMLSNDKQLRERMTYISIDIHIMNF